VVSEAVCVGGGAGGAAVVGGGAVLGLGLCVFGHGVRVLANMHSHHVTNHQFWTSSGGGGGGV